MEALCQLSYSPVWDWDATNEAAVMHPQSACQSTFGTSRYSRSIS